MIINGNENAGGAVAVIVVACVGFLLVLLVVGIVRLRAPSNRAQGHRYRRANSHGDGHDGLQWDDGELNIIVNPLEVRNCTISYIQTLIMCSG